jgi:hypothetical protein
VANGDNLINLANEWSLMEPEQVFFRFLSLCYYRWYHWQNNRSF